MANIKITMTQLRRMLQFLEMDISQRDISKKLHISRTSIAAYKARADGSGKTYQELLKLDDATLSSILQKEGYKPVVNIRFKVLEPLIPGYVAELNRKYVTYELLWNEYRQDHPDGYGYTRFKALIQAYEKAHTYSYHNVSAPGVEMQVDFAGDKLVITDRKTGLLTPVVVLCCSLTYSSMAFVMALLKATQEHFYYGLATCLNYFGGVPQSVKSDNMRQWVSRSDRYEPSFNEATMQWGLHYDAELVATRPLRPKDKATVEGLVNKAYQYIYARIRNEVFYSIEALNTRIFELVDAFNCTKMQGRTYSRLERFEVEERCMLRPLPMEPYVLKYSKDFTVNSTYHVQVGQERHFYSIPYEYINQKARAVYDCQTVEIYVNLKRVALHRRNFTPGGYTTETTHMPPHHQAYQRCKEYNADYFLHQGRAVGEHTTRVIELILGSKPFVQQAYRSCRGILSLVNKYSPERLEAACKRAGDTPAVNYQMVRSILERNLDKEEMPTAEQPYIPVNENVRGSLAYN